jgi:hypothetical protein
LLPQTPETSKMRHKLRLPIHITLFISLVFYFIGWQAIRLFTGIAWSNTLKTYESHFMPLYISATGAFWTLMGLFLLWCLWRGQRGTRLMFVVASSLYAIWVWADRLFFQTQMRANWPFDLILTIVLFIFTIIIVLHPRDKIYLERETYERES